MGDLVQSLWECYGEEGHADGFRLTLQHPEHGLLITEDVDWFLLRRVAFIPDATAASPPQPALQMLFHVDGNNVWTPIALSHTLPEDEDMGATAWLTLANPADQTELAMMADRWAVRLDVQHWQTQAHKIPSDQIAPLTTMHAWQPDGTTIRQWLRAIAETESVDHGLAALCDACTRAGISLD